MTDPRPLPDRLAFLVDVVALESVYLRQTDTRLFQQPMNIDIASALPQNIANAEQVDAFAARFGRLQDTVGDKLLPALLVWLGEPVGPVIDNLARAERWGWLESADDWLQLRQLRNRMVHEYIRDPQVLADALNAAHEGVPVLLDAARRMCREIEARSSRPGDGCA